MSLVLLQLVWIRSLVRKHMLHNAAKKKKKVKNQTNADLFLNKQIKQWNSIPVLKTVIENTLIWHRPDIKSAQSDFISEVKSLSWIRLFATPWTVAHKAPPSMELSRQQYWSGLPFPSPGDLPNPGIEPGSPTLQADALPSEPWREDLIKPNEKETDFKLAPSKVLMSLDNIHALPSGPFYSSCCSAG